MRRWRALVGVVLVVWLVGATGAGLLAGRPGSGLARAQAGGLESGALGLTRPEIEAMWGEGVGPFAGPGGYFNVYEMYSYYSQRGTYHVAYQDTNGIEIAVYLEITLPGGMGQRDSREFAARYLPEDARRTEVFTAPPSPDGATAVQSYRYVSPAMADVYEGLLPEEMLVTFYERWDDPEYEFGIRVTAISMMVRTITQ